MNELRIKNGFLLALFLAVISSLFFTWRESLPDMGRDPDSTPSIVFTVERETVQSSQLAPQTLYQVLSQMQEAGEISFSGKEYPGLGFFVTGIRIGASQLHQGGGKYLVFYVNGMQSSVGVSSFIPKMGDVIEWKLQ